MIAKYNGTCPVCRLEVHAGVSEIEVLDTAMAYCLPSKFRGGKDRWLRSRAVHVDCTELLPAHLAI